MWQNEYSEIFKIEQDFGGCMNYYRCILNGEYQGLVSMGSRSAFIRNTDLYRDEFGIRQYPVHCTLPKFYGKRYQMRTKYELERKILGSRPPLLFREISKKECRKEVRKWHFDIL